MKGCKLIMKNKCHVLLIATLIFSVLLFGCSNKKITQKKAKVPVKSEVSDKTSTSSLGNTKNNETSTANSEVVNAKGSYLSPVTISDMDTTQLSKKAISWSFAYPSLTDDKLKQFNSYYKSTNPSDKNLYLTFDEGYENGYTSKILDILKANNVKAAFFVTYPYVKSESNLIKRMTDEGNLVCNHSTKHKSMPLFTDQTAFNTELTTIQNEYESLTGKSMPRYFRPPEGAFSELSLYYTSKLGYKTIFWHFAYADWDPQKQPSEEYAKKCIIEKTHGGDVVLLHAVSKTNTDVLDYLIKTWKASGYTLETLDKLK